MLAGAGCFVGREHGMPAAGPATAEAVIAAEGTTPVAPSAGVTAAPANVPVASVRDKVKRVLVVRGEQVVVFVPMRAARRGPVGPCAPPAMPNPAEGGIAAGEGGVEVRWQMVVFEVHQDAIGPRDPAATVDDHVIQIDLFRPVVKGVITIRPKGSMS